MKKWMALFLALLMLTGLNAAMAEQDDMVFSDEAASTAMKNPSRF